MTEAVPLFDPFKPVEKPGLAAPSSEPDYAQMIATIQRWRRILAIRWLALLATLGAVAVWGGTVIAPDLWRLIAAAGYSAGVLVPVFWLYFARTD